MSSHCRKANFYLNRGMSSRLTIKSYSGIKRKLALKGLMVYDIKLSTQFVLKKNLCFLDAELVFFGLENV